MLKFVEGLQKLRHSRLAGRDREAKKEILPSSPGPVTKWLEKGEPPHAIGEKRGQRDHTE